LNVEIEATISNLETFPVTVTCGLATTSLIAAIASNKLALDLSEVHHGKAFELSGNAGMNRVKYKQRINCANFQGMPGYYLNSGNYTGVGSNNPALNLYWTHALAGTGNLTNGVHSSTRYQMQVKFFNRVTVFG